MSTSSSFVFNPSEYESYFRPFTKASTDIFDLNGMTSVARVVSVYDGDTFQFVIPLFDSKVFRFNARILGINTCELKDPDPLLKEKGILARNRLIQLITGREDISFSSSTQIVEYFERNVCLVKIQCGKMEKYGRVLVKVYMPDGRDVGDILLSEGHAVSFMCYSQHRKFWDTLNLP
jgi:endonuclease YncB( thermonuclease family)